MVKRSKQNMTRPGANTTKDRAPRSDKKVRQGDAPQPDNTPSQKTTGKEFTGPGRASPVAADLSTPKQGSAMISPQDLQIQSWPIDRLIFYALNARKNDAAVDRMSSSLREFGFK
jgi:hypothetical protein